ncbi:unnamed protein product, partial [Phaeothamnion confervicola]
WAAQEEAALASAAMAAAEAAAAAAAEVSADELVANGANEETVSSPLHEVVAAPAATPAEEPLTKRKQRPAAAPTLGEERSGIGDSTVSGVEAAGVARPAAGAAASEQGAAAANDADGAVLGNAASERSGASALPTTLPPPAATAAAAHGACFMVVRGRAKLREEPDAASLELATLRSGDV